jgi:hypothetical protein
MVGRRQHGVSQRTEAAIHSGGVEATARCWSFYNSLSEEDKNYIREFCPANPQQRALLPRASIVAGKAPERSLSCYA